MAEGELHTYSTPNKGYVDRAALADRATTADTVADASASVYVPGATSDWPNVPTEFQTALDELAARVKILEDV